MVSYRGRELRVHQGYLTAPPEVLAAIVTFVSGRTAASRRLARRRILAYPIARAPRTRRPDAPHPDDAPLAKRLVEWHRRYNDRHFDGALKTIPVRVSRRMRARLGHYMSAAPSGEPAEIVVSRRHIRRHGWEEALHTLLHEMVHQWQDETSHTIDHGATFRAKAREVGIAPYARRVLATRPGRAEGSQTLGRRAARDG
jgi:hypothetical protein